MILRLVKTYKKTKKIKEVNSLKSEIETDKKGTALIFIPEILNLIASFKKI